MKKYFFVSLIKNGVLGGSIVADSEAITYHTGKVTVSREYRHLVMKYEDICEVSSEWLFVLPTVTVKMRNGNEYKFAIFFNRKHFVDTLIDMGIKDSPTACQGIGYKEFYPYFDGKDTLESCIEILKRNSRRYAKRQLTWFKRNKEAIRIAADNLTSDEVFQKCINAVDLYLREGEQ